MLQHSFTIQSFLNILSKESYSFNGNEQQTIEHLAWNYVEVKKNTLYFCLENEEFQEEHIHGNSFSHWKDALQQGAVCLVISKQRIQEISNETKPISFIAVEDINRIMGEFCKLFYQDPFSKLNVIGITGTNGKTTTSQFLDSIFSVTKKKTGVIGTLGTFYPNYQESNYLLSTPLSTELFKTASTMLMQDVKTLIMEVTSHSISFQRTTSIDYDVAVFTNLTQDHLDYHKTFESYKNAKLNHFKRLGSGDKKAFGVINIDDLVGTDFVNAIPKDRIINGKVQVITYGIRNKEADIVAYPKKITEKHSEFDIFLRGDHLAHIILPMTGLFNIYNALASFSVAFCLNIPIEKITSGLSNVRQISGRFEKVDTKDSNIDVYIDYAHTPDSLENILNAVKSVARKKVIVVFGCGGDRDRGKRSKMGEIADRIANIIVITSDNPRTEDPEKIIQDILSGIPEQDEEKIFVEIDRKKAIHFALDFAKEGDAVLIAGKGHESYQIIGKTKIILQDRVEVEKHFQRKTFVLPRASVEISIPKLQQNFQLILKDFPRKLKLMSVVKDDGLGHGILNMAKEALKAACSHLAVCCMSEAMTLRNAGIVNPPILVFGERAESEIEQCVHHNLTLQIQSISIAKLIGRISKKMDRITKVHFKVDTGMGRYGVHWEKAVVYYKSLLDIEGIEIEGIMTHFAQSDEANKDYAKLQWNRFQVIIEQLKKENIAPPLIHACNTGGYLDLPFAHLNMVRIGILPTGVYPSKVCRRIEIEGEKLKPVMTVKSRVAFIKNINPGDKVGYGMHFTATKKMTLAVLPMGYGDGYPRLRNCGYVLIQGKQAHLIGGNAMDAMMVDVSHLDDVQKGEEVVLLGKQENEEITATQLADWAGTVCYEILSSWSPRMQRIEVN